MTDTDFRFHAPDRRQLWRGLALTMSQAAALTGVSERQIQHWMDRGYIQPSDHGARKINGDNLDKIVLIRQARIAGIPLRRAAAVATEYLNRENAGMKDRDVVPRVLSELNDRLGSLRGGIDLVQSLIRDLEGTNAARPAAGAAHRPGNGLSGLAPNGVSSQVH